MACAWPPSAFTAALDALNGKTVLADPATAAAAIFDRLNKAGAKVKNAADPCQLPKACKNPLELEGTRKAHIRDGAALSRFLSWFAREAPNGALTEIDAAQALEGFRRATNYLSDLSFDSISGAGSNGAIVHYRVTRSTNAPIRQQSDVPDRFRRAISRRHHRRHPHRDRGRRRRRKCATASPAC